MKMVANQHLYDANYCTFPRVEYANLTITICVLAMFLGQTTACPSTTILFIN